MITSTAQVLDALSPQPSIVSVLTHGLGANHGLGQGRNQELTHGLDDVLAPANSLDGGCLIVCFVSNPMTGATARGKYKIYCFREPARFSGWEQIFWIEGGGDREDRRGFRGGEVCVGYKRPRGSFYCHGCLEAKYNRTWMF